MRGLGISALCGLWESGAELVGAEAGDAQRLAAAGGTGEQSDAGARDVEFPGEEGDEGLVGAAIGGRSGQRYLQRAIVDAGDGVAPRPGMHADGKGAAVGDVANCEGSGHDGADTEKFVEQILFHTTAHDAIDIALAG